MLSCQETVPIGKISEINVLTAMCSWKNFLKASNWKDLIAGVEPIVNNNGLIYELPNFLKRVNESIAIVDMSSLKISDPHYHPTGNYEIYLILSGSALIIVGSDELHVRSGDVVIIPPNKAHFTVPNGHFVFAAISTPPFAPRNYIPIQETDSSVQFDAEKFNQLAHE